MSGLKHVFSEHVLSEWISKGEHAASNIWIVCVVHKIVQGQGEKKKRESLT